MEADIRSMSPSPSTSAAKTVMTPSALVETMRVVKFSLPSFSYQATLSSLKEADIRSMSPSPSTSMA
ncbi:hypothetical protein JYT84_00940 [bacterium AH-315-M10]|nr:hypothetical protein [bacterium AH-315-M10]